MATQDSKHKSVQRKLTRDEKLKLVQPHERLMTRGNKMNKTKKEQRPSKQKSRKKKKKKNQNQNQHQVKSKSDNEQRPHQKADSNPGDGECTLAQSLPSVWQSQRGE